MPDAPAGRIRGPIDRWSVDERPTRPRPARAAVPRADRLDAHTDCEHLCHMPELNQGNRLPAHEMPSDVTPAPDGTR